MSPLAALGRRVRVPGPSGRDVVGHLTGTDGTTVVVDLDGDHWTITANLAGDNARTRYRITDTDGHTIFGSSVRHLIGHAQRAGATFAPWTTDPDEADA
jgi:hypothetical protein